jgi:hypothetical protein
VATGQFTITPAFEAAVRDMKNMRSIIFGFTRQACFLSLFFYISECQEKIKKITIIHREKAISLPIVNDGGKPHPPYGLEVILEIKIKFCRSLCSRKLTGFSSGQTIPQQGKEKLFSLLCPHLT